MHGRHAVLGGHRTQHNNDLVEQVEAGQEQQELAAGGGLMELDQVDALGHEYHNVALHHDFDQEVPNGQAAALLNEQVAGNFLAGGVAAAPSTRNPGSGSRRPVGATFSGNLMRTPHTKYRKHGWDNY